MSNTSLPKIAIFCPLPPRKNGIADYLYEQIPYFSNYADIVVVIPDDQIEVAKLPGNAKALTRQAYLMSRKDFNGYHHVYHVGNNSDATYLLPILHSTPGTVVIHDLNLHHLMDLCSLAQGNFDSYTNILSHDYGWLGQRLGDQTKRLKLKGQFSTTQLLLNASIIDNAQHVIVHSQYAQRIVSARGQQQVSVIPHHLAPRALNGQSKLKDARRDLELPTDIPVFTSMGFIAEAKQITATLEALAELKAKGMNFLYILAGQCKANEYDVFSHIARLGLSKQVKVTGFLDEEAFYQYLSASDFIINLRYPSGGETSGTLTRALGMGLSCLVIDIGPFAEIPDSCAYKITYDNRFREQLKDAIEVLANSPLLRAEIGSRAATWIKSSQTLESTIPSYLKVITQGAPASGLSNHWHVGTLNTHPVESNIQPELPINNIFGDETSSTNLIVIKKDSSRLNITITDALFKLCISDWLCYFNSLLNIDGLLQLTILTESHLNDIFINEQLAKHGIQVLAISSQNKSILSTSHSSNDKIDIIARVYSKMLYLKHEGTSGEAPKLLSSDIMKGVIGRLEALSLQTGQDIGVTQ